MSGCTPAERRQLAAAAPLLDRLAELFAETFLAADPAGVQPVPRQAFLQALPRRAELFAAAGIARVVLDDLQHQALDATYVLARTDWRAERTVGFDLGAVVLDVHPAP